MAGKSVEPKAQVRNVVTPLLACSFAQLQFFVTDLAFRAAITVDFIDVFVEINSPTQNGGFRRIDKFCGFAQTHPKIFNHTLDYRSFDPASGRIVNWTFGVKASNPVFGVSKAVWRGQPNRVLRRCFGSRQRKKSQRVELRQKIFPRIQVGDKMTAMDEKTRNFRTSQKRPLLFSPGMLTESQLLTFLGKSHIS